SLCRIIAIAALLSAVSAAARAEPGVRHALIICGLAGDAAHRVLFANTVEQLYRGLTEHHDFSTDNVTVLWSEPKTDNDGPAISASHGPATRETIAAAAAALEKAVQPPDVLWVFALGH